MFSTVAEGWRTIRAAALALLLLPVTGCEQQAVQDEFGNLVGPVYSSERLNRQGLEGVRPGMTPEHAAAILAAKGYIPIARTPDEVARDAQAVITKQHFWIAASVGSDAYRFPQTVTLSYDRRTRDVVAIGHFQRITARARQDAAATRQSIVGRLGTPSLWRQDFYRSQLWDEMDYVALPAMRNQSGIERLRACHVDWQCENLLEHFDCRDTMRAGRETSLKISFGQDGNRIYYELNDYRRMYAAQMRTGKLATLDLRGAVCSAPAPHGGVGTTIIVPE